MSRKECAVIYHFCISTYKPKIRPLTYIKFKSTVKGRSRIYKFYSLAPKVRLRRDNDATQSELSAEVETSPDIRVQLLRITHSHAMAGTQNEVGVAVELSFIYVWDIRENLKIRGWNLRETEVEQDTISAPSD
jgi:hypothetical protein